MKEILQNIMIYRIAKGQLIDRFAQVISKITETNNKDALRDELYGCVKELLDLATSYGWQDNLWQCLLTYHLLTDENSYTLSKEREKEACGGSINEFLLHDMEQYEKLFRYDFTTMADKPLDISCFSVLCHYQIMPKRREMCDAAMGKQIHTIAKQLDQADSPAAMLAILDRFYAVYGVGRFAFHRVYRVCESQNTCIIEPIADSGSVSLHDLIGYEGQKQVLCANTEAFLQGKNANNVLLYGESGTGKSTSIKVIANQYYEQGLRLIEIHKHQFHLLHEVIAQIKKRNYGFIIYMDDLSFEEDETQYKYLKAVMEGGLELRPAHVLIYATSNRRHLIKETWRDRTDVNEEQDLHLSETMSEKLSLVARFGISIYYGRPTPQEYHAIVKELARREGLQDYSEDELWQIANAWELRHGGVSGRCARQLIDDLNARGNQS